MKSSLNIMKNSKAVCCSCNRPLPISEIKSSDILSPSLEDNGLPLNLPIRSQRSPLKNFNRKPINQDT